MKHVYAAVLFTLMFLLSCSAEDWPTWQHDNRRTGTTNEQLATKDLNPDWTWQSSAPPQTAWAGPAKYDAYARHRNLPSMRNYDSVFHPIVVGDRIWFGSSVDDSLLCLDLQNGIVKWTVTADGPVRLAPTWSEQRIYFGSDDGYARCVKADSGELIWKFSPTADGPNVINNGRFISFQPCRTGVVVDNGTAWFANAMLPWKDSFLCAVDAKTGKQNSPAHFVKKLPGRTMEGAPALSSTALILPQGRVSPRVFDRHNGDDLGEMKKSGGGSVVIVSLDETVLHGPASDSRKGGFRKSDKNAQEVAALGAGNALVVDGLNSWMLTDDSIVATDLKTSKQQWKQPCDCPFAMIKAGDVLYVGGDRVVAAYSAKDGKELWRHPAEGRVFGLVAANGRLVVSGDTGAIQCFSANNKNNATTTGEPSVKGLDSETTEPAQRVTQIQAIDDDRLLGHWAFQRSDAVDNRLTALSGPDLTLSKRGRFSAIGQHDSLELNGTDESAMISPKFRTAPHPKKSFTAEAWLRLEQLQEWGGIVGIIQDDGKTEHGWLLGYRKDRFSIAVRSTNGPANLTYLTADSPFELSRWYHVAGTYDGETMRLFVDGKQCAQSDLQSGDISYPERAWFEIGAYHDKDEYFRMSGAIHEVRLYDQDLAADEIAQHFQEGSKRFPAAKQKATIPSGPWLTFDDPHAATVRWSTATAQPTRLEFGRTGFNQTILDAVPKTEHVATVRGLQRNLVYQYRIGIGQRDDVSYTEEFECDNFFNYSPPAGPQQNKQQIGSAPLIRHVLSQCGTRAGMALIFGEIDVATLTELCRQSRMRFVVAAKAEKYVTATRSALKKANIVAAHCTVQHCPDLSKLPYSGNWANLVLVTATPITEVIREARHQVQPGGNVLVVNNKQVSLPQEFEAVPNEDSLWVYRATKPTLAGAGEWSHLYGKPDNSAFGGEQLAGVTSADDLEVHWVGRPGPRYQADRSGRKPSPLSIGGRLFLQGLHRIVAVDAFNGTILWSLEIPGLERFNMPRDCSNWCVESDFLFAVVRHECWKIRVDTGEVVARVPAETESNVMEWGYIATDQGRLYGSSVKSGTSWTNFWGGGDEGWYDARSGAVTFPICSDKIFCRDVDSMNLVWEYKRGVVLNPTITVSGDTMYFVECRSSKILESDERRIGDPELWKNLHLVAIDSKTGSPKWERKLPPLERQVIFYLAHANKQLTMVSSSDKSYRVTSLHNHDGSERWNQTTLWPGGKGDHGKAMMRPAIVGDRIILRPNVLSLTDGKILPEKMPDGHGCGTYSCTADAVFYRASTLVMWSPESKEKSTWSRLRPDCWLSTIPAGGMLLSPEGGGGCSCGSWMETSIGFIPKKLGQRIQPAIP